MLEFTTGWWTKDCRARSWNLVFPGLSLNQNTARLHFEVSSLCGTCAASSNCSWMHFDDWAVFGIEGSTYRSAQRHRGRRRRGRRSGETTDRHQMFSCNPTNQPTQQKQDSCMQYSRLKCMRACVCNYYPGQGMPIAWVAHQEFDSGSRSRNSRRCERFVICASWWKRRRSFSLEELVWEIYHRGGWGCVCVCRCTYKIKIRWNFNDPKGKLGQCGSKEKCEDKDTTNRTFWRLKMKQRHDFHT